MMTVGKTDHITRTGWSAGGVLATIITTKALTAFVISFPLTWLVNHVLPHL